MRKLITLRPRTIGPDMHLESNSQMDAIQSLAQLFGLVVVSTQPMEDEQGTPYTNAVLGNGSRWTAYDAVNVEYVKPA